MLNVEQALPAVLESNDISREPEIGPRLRPDFIARLPTGNAAIIEVKSVTPTTRARLSLVLKQLQTYAEAYTKLHEGSAPELILAIPGRLTGEHIRFLTENGIAQILDGPALRAAAPMIEWSEDVARSTADESNSKITRAKLLLSRLETTAPGKGDWSKYQKLIGEILGDLFSPPLNNGINEKSNLSKVNRRDIILPNYSDGGFWQFMRLHYDAHFVVVDAKNYVRPIKKNEVLQIANYLNLHGAGLFAIIACRNSIHSSAEVTIREQWVLHRKLVVVLNDDDIKQMLHLHIGNQDPSEVVKQKIEDFRLGF